MIDAWIQHPNPGFLGHEMFEPLRRWMGLDEAPDVFPIDFTLAALDAAGIDVGVLCAWHGPEGAHISNEEVAAAVAAHPTRFIGLASVDVRRPMNGVRALRHAVSDLGLRGLRILPWLWELHPDDRRFYPLYAACVELGIPLCLQVGQTGPLRPSEFGRPIPHLDRVALEFPELVIVAGHIGFPWTNEMIGLATKFLNVYIDTSAYTPRRYPPELVTYMRGHGRKKVLFGSNWPMIEPRKCIAEVGALGLDAEGEQAFLHGNAARVFGIG